MTLDETMTTLEAMGTEQNRKIYRRHGARDPLFGVSYANFGKLKKQLKTDHALALQLWDTGNYDARQLATMIADPKQLGLPTLTAWLEAGPNYPLTDSVAGLASKTPAAHAALTEWIKSDDEWVESGGWHVLADLALQDQALSDAFFEPYLNTIEHTIHQAKNRVRYEMNSALIAIGIRNDALEARAIDIAGKIGKVYVDHGETGCKTPDAIPYIRKTRAHQKARAMA